MLIESLFDKSGSERGVLGVGCKACRHSWYDEQGTPKQEQTERKIIFSWHFYVK